MAPGEPAHGSRAGIPQETTEPRAASSLQQHGQSELSAVGHGWRGAAFHYLQGAGQEKLQLQSLSWLLVGTVVCGSDTEGASLPKAPTSIAHHPRREQRQRLGPEWMSFSGSLLASALCSPLTFHRHPHGGAHGDAEGNPQAEWGRLSFVHR